ncbi:CHC2 zinc finger domain-containing protein [uncultured Sphingomonas sp.]|uniref:DUF7146 domain-containing protein n=1 Tax=uncultured Sphingomonas sp. TaxID=158754 RepID=UPI0025F939DB|nr:CHC2 zinc finger domain-containing protein [uncultured Sphingomonas sp.]
MREGGSHRARGSRSPERDAAFRRAVDQAKQRYNISDVIGRYTKLKKAGARALRGLCPFHSERTPSFHVYDADGGFHCFGCAAHGDIIDFLRLKQGVGMLDAVRWLDSAALPEVTEEQRAQQRAEDEADRAASIELARTVWRKAVPAAGTPAETYAQARGIRIPLPPSIRFARTPAWYDRETDECGPNIPAVIGCVQGADGEFMGIQRIFLGKGGREKARMPKPKLTLGRFMEGALRLGAPAEQIIECEGPEDGWTLMQEMPGSTVWVALGTSNMAAMRFPEGVRSVRVAGDNGTAGETAAAAALKAHAERGLAVDGFFPIAGFKDFNDQLRGVRS